jgi:hypothetical protein
MEAMAATLPYILLSILGAGCAYFGLAASWPFPALTSEAEMLLGVVMFGVGAIGAARKLSRRNLP